MFSNESAARKSDRLLSFLLYFGFFLIGVSTVLIGQVLPILSARLSLNDNEAGYFFVVQFSGSLLGTLAANRFVRRMGFPFVLLIGFSLSAIGALSLNSDSLPISLAAFFTIGGGVGLTIPSINLLTVELNRKKTSSALNVVNFFWGFGAILCKPFVDLFGGGGGGGSVFLPTSILALFLLLVGLTINFLPAQISGKTKSEENRDENFAPVWTTSTAWLIAAFNFLQIGLESGVGGWITTYAARMPHQNHVEWLSAASVFFLFLVAGRGGAPLFLRFLSDDALLFCSLLIVPAGIILLLAASDFQFIVAGAAVAGFGCASIFPVNMSRFVKTFGANAARRTTTPLFVAGTLGGASTTYSIGLISAKFDDLRVGMFVLLAVCVILIILQIVLSRRNIDDSNKNCQPRADANL